MLRRELAKLQIVLFLTKSFMMLNVPQEVFYSRCGMEKECSFYGMQKNYYVWESRESISYKV